MELRLVPFVRIRTVWSDDAVTESGHLEEWFAAHYVLGCYAYALLPGHLQRFVLDLHARGARLWGPLQRRPVKAILFDRVFCAGDVPGPVQ